MAYAKPFRIETPPPSLEETAKVFGMSDAEIRRTRRAVHEIIAREHHRQTRPRRARKAAAR